MPVLDHGLLGKINLCFSFDDGEDGLRGFWAQGQEITGGTGYPLKNSEKHFFAALPLRLGP